MNEGIRRHLDEANVSTESNPPKTGAWISGSDELPWWSRDLEAPASERAKAPRSHDSVEVAVFSRTGRFERADRLLRPRDFQRVARNGRRTASRQFVILMAPLRQTVAIEKTRLGVTVSRRVGNAVVRNRIKRAVREWFRWNRGRLEERADLVVIARQGAEELSTREITGILDEMMFSPERARR
jgi:ribonuclease P protein component